MEEEHWERRDISEGTIRSTAKRKSSMKILLFLKRRNRAHTVGEIADELDMDWGTVTYNLRKLLECGFIENVEDRMDGRTKYYRITDGESLDKAIELYIKRVSFRLARLIPYKRILAEQLKSDSRFVEACQELELTFREGISAVAKCPKIGSEYNSNQLILWRTEQGYDSPKKKEHEEVKTGEREVEEVE